MTDWATAKYDIERFLDIDIEAERAKEQEQEVKKRKIRRDSDQGIRTE